MIIVAGTIRIPEDRLEELLPVARSTLEATRREAGCNVYSFAVDLADTGLFASTKNGKRASTSMRMASKSTWCLGAPSWRKSEPADAI
jgi:hypothetical protein